MNEVLERLKTESAFGHDVVLVTVRDKWGSAPRGAGAQMLVGQEGRLCGTVGGGRIEYLCEQMGLQVLKEKESLVHRFFLSQNEIEDIGMVCGGEVEVDFSFVTPEDSDVIKEMEEREAIRQKEAGIVYVFGGGHVAQALVPVLAAVDFQCVVLEDRAEFCNRELFPQAYDVKWIDNKRIGDFVSIGKEDYVCIMTRGHKDDILVQEQVLKSPARYIGVIGSRAKKAAVFAKLSEQGFTREDLARIHTPIGLAIGAETPEEIAVSIAAEMIQIRSGFH